MIELYTHKVMTSFCMWFDHTLLQKGQAFSNQTTPLYYRADDRTEGVFTTYSSPFKQWVSDSSVDNAVVASGITTSAGFIPRGVSGLMLDFENGRALLNPNIPETETITASYSVKDFNIYMTEDNEQKLIFEKLFNLNSRYGNIEPSGVPPYEYVLPACFIMQNTSNNTPYAFGGEQDSQSKIRVIIMTDLGYHLDGCISIFRDLTESNIALFSSQDSPINEYGDLKSGSYNYLDLVNRNQDERMLFITKVTSSKIVNVSERRNFPNIKFGILDFYLSEPRVPKQDL